MSRRVELISGALSAALGLIGLAYMLNGLNSSFLLGSGGGFLPRVAVEHDLLIAALACIEVGVGAYLHSIYGQGVGLALLVFSAALLVVGTVYLLFSPGPFLQVWPLLSVVLPREFPAIAALTLILAVVSVLAAVTPTEGLEPTRRGGESEGHSRTRFLSRFVPR